MADTTGESLELYSRRQKFLAYSVHAYTATGLLFGALIAADIIQHNYRRAFVWMIVTVLIDATDGTFARKVRVKEVVPHIDGRKLDDIVDYLNYTFLPLLMIVTAGWLPQPSWLWASVPLIASVFAFVHMGAKEESNRFFRGFPSYWNVFAFYTAVWLAEWGHATVLVLALVLSGLSLLPVRFVYPNRAPRWRAVFVGGAIAWMAVIGAILWYYPTSPIPHVLLWLSVIYPAFYVAASIYLDWKLRGLQPPE
jgi:phosphatidylcholine synthase